MADIGKPEPRPFTDERGFSRFSCQNALQLMKIIPTDDVIADLEHKATDCEAKAESEAEPMATQLKDEAKRIRGWIADLKSGRWSSAIK